MSRTVLAVSPAVHASMGVSNRRPFPPVWVLAGQMQRHLICTGRGLAAAVAGHEQPFVGIRALAEELEMLHIELTPQRARIREQLVDLPLLPASPFVLQHRFRFRLRQRGPFFR
jgi:hypothetical protein